eukprot:1754968-Prymnesium_polylepis.4
MGRWPEREGSRAKTTHRSWRRSSSETGTGNKLAASRTEFRKACRVRRAQVWGVFVRSRASGAHTSRAQKVGSGRTRRDRHA